MSYLDQVDFAANFGALPAQGFPDRIYVAEDTYSPFCWNGAAYVQMGATVDKPGIATTSTDGITLTNSIPATVVDQVQMSPRIRLRGHAWKSDAVAESQSHDWIVENLPAAGASVTTSTLKFGHSFKGGAYTYPLTVSSEGTTTITPQSAVRGLSVIQANASNGIYVDSNTTGDFAGIYCLAKRPMVLNQDIPNGYGLMITRNNNNPETYALMMLINEHASDTQATLSLRNDGLGPHITTGGTDEDLVIRLNGTGTTKFWHSGGAAGKYIEIAPAVGDAVINNQAGGLYFQAGGINTVAFTAAGIYLAGNGKALDAYNIDNAYGLIRARNTGTFLVEVARIAGAADSYFSMGGAQEFKFYNSGIAVLSGTVELKLARFGTVALPADAAHRGMLYFVEGAGGVADKLYCIMKSATDTYSAIQVAIG